MAKARKPPAAPEPPRVGDKVKPGKSEMVYTVGHVSPDGKEVNLRVSQDAIYDLPDQGAIPTFTIGKQRRFDPKTVAYWIRKKDPTFAQAAKAA